MKRRGVGTAGSEGKKVGEVTGGGGAPEAGGGLGPSARNGGMGGGSGRYGGFGSGVGGRSDGERRVSAARMSSRRLRTLALAGGLLLSASAAGAQTADTASVSPWIQVAQSTSIRVSVDPARVRVLENGHIRIWSRWDYPNGRLIDGKRIAYALSQDEFDCEGEQTIAISNVTYDRVGTVVEWFADPDPQWRAAVPNSLMEGVLHEVCAYVARQQ